MKSHFIEGTNEQYSIREDGTIIRHYRGDKWGNKLVKDVLVKPYLRLKKNNNSKSMVVIIGYPQQQYSLRTLMETYFDIEGKPSKILGYKDGDKTNYNLSNLYYKQPLGVKYINKKARDNAIKNLSPWYIASKLNISVDELTSELYEHHKQLILFKRKVSKKHNISINTLK